METPILRCASALTVIEFAYDPKHPSLTSNAQDRLKTESSDTTFAFLQNGLLWGLPIVMDTDSEDIGVGDTVLLKYQGQDIATFEISTKWRPNKPLEALKCYGTSSIEHPAVQMISMERGKYYLGELSCPGMAFVQPVIPA